MKKRYLYISVFFILIVFASCNSISKTNFLDSDAAITSLAPVVRTAEKPDQGVYYCIFIRSFADSNGDGIGDFDGIINKLDYLNDGNDLTTNDLGITGIWLMPIYPSQSYHGYDIDDYYNVNPDYGSLKDFKNLVTECKKRGISVILDLPCNHSSVYTDWFKSSRDPDSTYRNWYIWISGDDARYNIKQKIWGHNLWNLNNGCYYSGLFQSGMPDFNLDEPAVREEFKKIAHFWLNEGVSGFRFDAAMHIYNKVKIPAGENSVQKGIQWWKEYTDYIRSIKSDAYNVGEVWSSTSDRAAYMAGLQSDFHFDMGTKIIDYIKTGENGKNNYANYLYTEYKKYAQINPDYIDAPFLSNHDQNRIAGLLKGDTDKLKLAASLYILAEGVPFIYYGEEIGMMGAKPDEQIRTPMIWNKKGKDHFQTSWIESKYNKKTISVALQQKDKNSLLVYYKRLIRLKTKYPSLYKGRFTPFDTGNPYIASWIMQYKDEKSLITVNLSELHVSIQIPQEYRMSVVFASDKSITLSSTGLLSIPPMQTAVLIE